MCQQKRLKYIDVTEETLTSLNRASIPVVRIWVSDGLTRASCMICLDSEARHLKQRPFSGLVNKNTGAGYSPIISVLCVNVAISKTSRTFKSVFFIRCRRSDSSIFVDKWNLASATIARSFSQRPQAAIRQLRAWPRIHVQPRFQRGFRNGVTFLRVVYSHPVVETQAVRVLIDWRESMDQVFWHEKFVISSVFIFVTEVSQIKT